MQFFFGLLLPTIPENVICQRTVRQRFTIDRGTILTRAETIIILGWPTRFDPIKGSGNSAELEAAGPTAQSENAGHGGDGQCCALGETADANARGNLH